MSILFKKRKKKYSGFRFFSEHNLSFEMKQERGINGRANFHAPITDSPIVGGCVVQVYSYIYI